MAGSANVSEMDSCRDVGKKANNFLYKNTVNFKLGWFWLNFNFSASLQLDCYNCIEAYGVYTCTKDHAENGYCIYRKPIIIPVDEYNTYNMKMSQYFPPNAN